MVYRGWHLAVVGDHGGILVEVAEVQAGRGELGHVELVVEAAGLGAQRVRLLAGVLEPGGHRAVGRDHLERVLHGELRHLLGDWLALGLVSVEDARVRPAVKHGGERPGQVEGVRDARVHPVPGVRHPQARHHRR